MGGFVASSSDEVIPLIELDRIMGCFLGGALGDAFGGRFEGGEANRQQEFVLSDDTQLTLATCEAIYRAECIDPESIASNFVQWFSKGRLSGLGSSTLKALRDLEVGAHWALAGAQGERAAGNGAAMRIAPLAFLLKGSSVDDRQVIKDVARITHRNDEAYLGALALVLALQRVMEWGEEFPHDLVRHVAAKLPDCNVRDGLYAVAEFDACSTVTEVAENCGASGYVAESVPLALFAASRAVQFGVEIVLEEIAISGGDTDTISSMAGQLFGLHLGEEKLPKELLSSIEQIDEVVDIAREFAAFIDDGQAVIDDGHGR